MDVVLERAPLLKEHVLQIRIFEKLAALLVTFFVPASHLA